MDEEMEWEHQELENQKGYLVEVPEEMPHLVRNNLDMAQDKLASVSKTVKFFAILEKTLTEVNELSDTAEEVDHDIKFRQQEIMDLKLLLSQLQERKTVLDKKFLALKVTLQSFSSKGKYWEVKEARARTRLNVCSEHVEQKKEELRCLQTLKDEINTAMVKAQDFKSQLRTDIDRLKSKLHDAETQRKKTEKVLFAIDNRDNADDLMQKGMNFGKASELLKSEEKRSKLSAEMKKLQEKMVIVKKETVNLVKKAEATDAKIKNIETSIDSGLVSLQQSDDTSQQVREENNMLSEMHEDGISELGRLLVELQNCILILDLKEAEILLCEEIMQHDMRRLDEIKAHQILQHRK